MARLVRLPLLIAALCAFAAPSRAQAANAPQTPRSHSNGDATASQPLASLYGPWKFALGDSPIDPATNAPLWAEPGFDDSAWETVDLTPASGLTEAGDGWSGYIPGWTARGHAGKWGYAWYRIQVRISGPLADEKKALGVWDVDDAFQFFANGALLGSSGKFSGPGQRILSYYSKPLMFELPESRSDPNSYTLAFRVWLQPYSVVGDPECGGLHIAPVLGETNAVASAYQHAWIVIVRVFGSSVLDAFVYLGLAIFCASLILFDRTDRVYPWLAGLFLVSAFDATNACVESWTQLESESAFGLINAADNALILGGWVMAWWFWWEMSRPRWLPKAVALLTTIYAFSFAFSQGPMSALFKSSPLTVDHDLHIVLTGTRLAFLGLIILVGFYGVRQRGREGWIALPGVVLMGLSEFRVELIYLHIPTRWYLFGIGFNLGEAAQWLLSAVMFTLLLRRLLLSLRRQRQMALDVKQAQEVQQLILPEKRLTVPGLEIETEYRPALEVGGDFFQIIPSANGGLLVVAGDVTGKGLKAGMLVALLIGAIRTLTRFSSDPAEILQELNARLVGRSDARATCVALHISLEGQVTVANAGHFPPYLNGLATEMEGSLPLGMIDSPSFASTHLTLSQSDRLTLLSDGVIEAADQEGTLFGFDRVLDLLRGNPDAGQIADAAQAFGQTDDISVISITRVAVPGQHLLARSEIRGAALGLASEQ